jgi:hypothetical protein
MRGKSEHDGDDPRKIGLKLIFRHGVEARAIAEGRARYRNAPGDHANWPAILAAIDELMRPTPAAAAGD